MVILIISAFILMLNRVTNMNQDYFFLLKVNEFTQLDHIDWNSLSKIFWMISITI